MKRCSCHGNVNQIWAILWTIAGQFLCIPHMPTRFYLHVQVKESVSIPVVANGDIFSNEDVEMVVNLTHVDGEY